MAKKKKAGRSQKLTPRQKRFVKEYLAVPNGTTAAIKAGYSSKAATATASRMLTNAKVAAEIEKGQTKIEKKLDVTAEDIAAELVKLGFSNMDDYMKVSESGLPKLDWSNLTREQKAALQEVTVDEGPLGSKKVKFKLADKRAALVDLAKLLGYIERQPVRLDIGINGNISHTHADATNVLDAYARILDSIAKRSADGALEDVRNREQVDPKVTH